MCRGHGAASGPPPGPRPRPPGSLLPAPPHCRALPPPVPHSQPPPPRPLPRPPPHGSAQPLGTHQPPPHRSAWLIETRRPLLTGHLSPSGLTSPLLTGQLGPSSLQPARPTVLRRQPQKEVGRMFGSCEDLRSKASARPHGTHHVSLTAKPPGRVLRMRPVGGLQGPAPPGPQAARRSSPTVLAQVLPS